jgi:nucleoside-diphosphate-sugar epimerase
MKTILVTGAAGFIGRHVCRNLVRGGFTVVGITRDKVATSETANSSYPLVAVDLRQGCEIQSTLASLGQRRLDAVIHLAAQISPTLLGEEAERAATTNCLLDENVFRFCANRRIPAVYASGTVVYGFGSGEAQEENSKLRPVGPYAAAKLIGEQRGIEYLGSKDVPFTVLRICAPYGPFQISGTVVRIFLRRALRGLPLLYHGFGSRQQDFTFVEDVADAFRCVLQAGRSGTYNIAGGAPVSMLKLAELIRDTVPGCRSDILPSGNEDPQEGVSAFFPIAKATTELAWRPTTSLRVGIEKCVEAEGTR